MMGQPKPGTQAAAVLRVLQRGGCLTCRWASRTLGVNRLERVVYDLRVRYGLRQELLTLMVPVPTRYQRSSTHIALYCLRGREPADPKLAVSRLAYDQGLLV